MKSLLLTSFIIAALAVPAFSQQEKKEIKDVKETKEAKETKATSVYSRIVLEDFETSQYNESNIRYKVTTTEKGGIAVRDQFPSPAKDSKKYLGVKILGKSGDVVQIIPAKPLVIDKYCQTISMWVYGKELSGELSIMLQDSEGGSHRLIMGRLNFEGWKELSVNIPNSVAQMDKYLSQKKKIELTRIMYNPGNTGRLPIWNYVYIDDITATVREKMYDKQSDEW